MDNVFRSYNLKYGALTPDNGVGHLIAETEFFDEAPPVTWNPADKSTYVVLSNNDLSFNGLIFSAGSVRATVGVSTGKRFWEYKISSTPGTNGSGDCVSVHLGIQKITPTNLDSFLIGDSDGVGYYPNGDVVGGGVVDYGYGSAFAAGDVIGVALDMDNGQITFYKNGLSLGVAAVPTLSGTYYPAATQNGCTVVVTANFGATAFDYSIPSGYTALQDGTPSGTIYNDSLSNAVTAVATESSTAVMAAILGETSAAGSAESGGLSLSGSLTESVTSAASESSIISLSGAVTEGLTASDSNTSQGDYNASLSNPVTSGDSAASTADTNNTLGSAVVGSDGILAGLSMSENVVNDATGNDAVTVVAIYGNSLLSTIISDFLTDGEIGSTTFNESLTEAIAASFGLSSQAEYVQALAEAIGTAFSPDSVITYYSTLEEALAADDNNISSLTIAGSINENISAIVTQSAGSSPKAYVYTSQGWVGCTIRAWNGSWSGRLNVYNGEWNEVT